jgi:UPF0755 protein
MSLNALKLSKISLGILGLVLGLVVMVMRQQNELTDPQVILVKKGMTASQVIRQLKATNIIPTDLPLRIWAKLDFRKIQEGEYIFPPRATLFEVIRIIWGGHSTFIELVIPEGSNSWDVERLLEGYVSKEQFWSLWTNPDLILLAGEPAARSLEGLLAPNTYYINHAMEPVDILKMLVLGSKTYYPPRQINNGLSAYETLILASLIESEATVNSERDRIASVFLNRLKQGIPLQCDPTVQYSKFKLGLPNPMHIGGSDLRRSHPYNTYRISGLPPGPICSPGLPSMNAATKSSTTQELYFVADGNGTHVFSSTLEDHIRAVQAYRKIQAEKKIKARESP